ncbi:Na(+)-translocating NADH-quinone reductase subunit A [Xanthovirga aplysinae]|uniref:Na(+)-translocating NADH-quinone reductase subunit A n=1 Tax=Xanthovirga aplysinae TaxID=2529853 RepID=UPI0012BBDCC4|nr:Na(+)-translocating NADH-quinone reductase subunit A [Xanthovirga aplysinae]MTI30303.1 Na(+)-translocating NADH-quinone reductase subunit A [Xanthovirga aplysinae]
MSKLIKLKKGFDIKLVGKAEKKIAEAPQPETFAVKPTDYPGFYMPKMLVKEGDVVKAGTPIFYDKKKEGIFYAAPVSGEVVEVKRGEKRKLLEVKILADKQISYEEFSKFNVSELTKLSRKEATEQLLNSGVWPNIIQRPYGIVADPNDTPKAIFISAFDSHPLAADLSFTLKGEEQNFQAGLEVLSKFTDGKIHLNVNADSEDAAVFSQAKDVVINKISGPHPAGNVGVQIHHIDPINKGDVAWTVSPFGVAQIGKLFLTGHYDASRVIAVAGSEVKNPQYYKTYTGASIKKFVGNNLKSNHVRFVSGNVLTGEKVDSDGHLGFYHNLLTVIPEGDYYEMLGWALPSKRLSFQRALGLLSFLNPNKEYVMDTNTRGEKRAFVQTGVFEQVTPMDILPTHLIKAVMAEDYDNMEALGIYEVVEEDLALCEFVDVSKHDIQAILRHGIDLMLNS